MKTDLKIPNMSILNQPIGFALGLLLFLCLDDRIAFANVTIAPIFSDHVVLQRDKPLVIWGRAEPNEQVKATLGETHHGSTTADSNGNWSIDMGILKTSSQSRTLRVVGNNEVEVKDVLIGDVYHASGQSNMAMNVGACAKSIEEIRKIADESDFPNIRFTRIADGPSREQLDWLRSAPKWTKCSPQSVSRFSAVAFFCARRIHLNTRIPIGIIDSSRGGTPIEPFIPVAAFAGHPTLVRERELGDKDDLEGLKRLPGGVWARDANWLPGRLFNSRLAPLKRFSVAGILWYQAESNCGTKEDPNDYQFKMLALISGWQAEISDVPFCFVQLPGSGAGPNWPYMREQQRLAAAASDPDRVGMIVTIDLAHPDIHPPNKLDVGERMAAWLQAKSPAYATTHDRNAYSGPDFASATVSGQKIIVRFTHAESGLMIAEKSGVAPVVATPKSRLNHFDVLDTAGVWHPAEAEIRDGQIEITAQRVTEPVAARYAYSKSPVNCNLYNKDGFPASPFCTHPDRLRCDPE